MGGAEGMQLWPSARSLLCLERPCTWLDWTGALTKDSEIHHTKLCPSLGKVLSLTFFTASGYRSFFPLSGEGIRESRAELL